MSRIWRKTFPDPSTSPAHYTRAPFIGGPKVVTTVDLGEGSWIEGFSRVVHLAMVGQDPFAFGWGAAFVQFRGLSVVKSLRVNRAAFPSMQLSDLVLSFPLLEDLSVTGDCFHTLVKTGSDLHGLSIAIRPSSLPLFTGSLELFFRGGTGPIVHGWVSLPGGIHFRKLTLTWFREEDIPLTMALVEKCYDTLESLNIGRDGSRGTSIRHLHLYRSNLPPTPADPKPATFNLSNTTKLRDVVFRPQSLTVKWISLALQAVTSDHQDLRRISVDVPYHLAGLRVGEDPWRVIGEGLVEEWFGLDRILLHLLESLSIRTDVIWTWGGSVRVLGNYIGCLLPEVMKRGMVTINTVE